MGVLASLFHSTKRNKLKFVFTAVPSIKNLNCRVNLQRKEKEEVLIKYNVDCKGFRVVWLANRSLHACPYGCGTMSREIPSSDRGDAAVGSRAEGTAQGKASCQGPLPKETPVLAVSAHSPDSHFSLLGPSEMPQQGWSPFPTSQSILGLCPGLGLGLCPYSQLDSICKALPCQPRLTLKYLNKIR